MLFLSSTNSIYIFYAAFYHTNASIIIDKQKNNIMNKLYFLLLIFPTIICSCDKSENEVETSTIVTFEKNPVVLNSDLQETEIQASSTYWTMTVTDENNSIIEGDTINGSWYTLIKKNDGKSILIKVANNPEKERKLSIGIKKINYYSLLTIIQKAEEK
ncbi:hypothetical protein GCM10007084_02520 [Parabacteroides faecis]|nr:hypothetical protein GCM10007084_02520 [Parabacteroides faecis]